MPDCIKMNPVLWERHKNCECYVDKHYRANRSRSLPRQQITAAGGNPNPPALMCQQHQVWLKWLSYQEADAIESVSQEA